MTVVDAPADVLGRVLVLDDQVAVRDEPFGALAYHYGTRRLVFLKHPDIVQVVRALEQHDSVADALTACGIAPHRHRSFARAIAALITSGMLRDRAR